jgi:hypothetical protein
LTNVAGEVKEEVADAVRPLVRPPPEPVRRKRLDREPKLGPVFVSEKVARALEKRGGEIHVTPVLIAENNGRR